jgi:hypothetical protein
MHAQLHIVSFAYAADLQHSEAFIGLIYALGLSAIPL